jgi:hypothetical protein
MILVLSFKPFLEAAHCTRQAVLATSLQRIFAYRRSGLRGVESTQEKGWPPGVAKDEVMLRFLVIGACFVGLAACASTAPKHESDAQARAATASLGCTTTETANRSPPRNTGCSAGDVKSYTGEQLEATGATQAGDALRYLDPEITIIHH